jgi:integrase
MNKKIFVKNEITYTVVYANRVYITWYVTVNGIKIRKKVYAGINRVVGENEQFIWAVNYIDTIVTNSNKLSLLKYTLVEDEPNLRKKSISTLHVRINKWVDWLKSEKINELTVNDETLKKFVKYLRSKNLSGATINAHCITIKRTYAKANLFPFSKNIKIVFQSKSLTHFTNFQSTQIINYCKEKNYTLYLAIKFLFHCFVRPGEMRFLKMEHIDFENKVISIPASISKNKKQQPIIIPDNFFNEIEHLQSFKNSDYVIGKNKIGSCTTVSANYLNREHSKILKILNITGNYALYSWKHTGVIRAVKSGINLKDLQMQLRHHSLDMVNEYLKNLGVMDSEDLRNKMPNL